MVSLSPLLHPRLSVCAKVSSWKVDSIKTSRMSTSCRVGSRPCWNGCLLSSVVHSSLLSVFPIGPQGTTCFKPLLQISKTVRTAVEVVHEDAVPLVSEPVIVKVIQHQPMSQTKVRSRYVIFLYCVQLPVPYIPICSISQYPCFYLPLLWLLGHVLQKASRLLNHIRLSTIDRFSIGI